MCGFFLRVFPSFANAMHLALLGNHTLNFVAWDFQKKSKIENYFKIKLKSNSREACIGPRIFTLLPPRSTYTCIGLTYFPTCSNKKLSCTKLLIGPKSKAVYSSKKEANKWDLTVGSRSELNDNNNTGIGQQYCPPQRLPRFAEKKNAKNKLRE